jgi:hypothetical protein
MNQRQVILTVVAVGLVSAALWAWHQSSNNPDAPPAHAAAPTPANPFSPSSGRVAAARDAAAPAPAAPPQPQAPPAAPDVSQSTVSAPVEPPNVDTPEPAEQKFARGAHRQSEQN